MRSLYEEYRLLEDQHPAMTCIDLHNYGSREGKYLQCLSGCCLDRIASNVPLLGGTKVGIS